MRRHLAWILEQLMPHEESRAERTAGIAGCRLNPKIGERSFAQQLSVGNTVESDTAGEHEILFTGEAMCFPRHVQNNFLGHHLDAGGKIHVTLFELRFRLPRRSAEQLME